ncbi:MAG: cysteine--tRNA ligase [Mycobacteriales bacterium]
MLRLMDTRTRRVEEIVPTTAGVLRMYACGPTVYKFGHLGNLRSYLLADLVRRVAERHHLRVELVQNITDVGHLQDDTTDTGEDKVLTAARAEGRSASELARFYEAAFHRDLAALNIRPAAAYPRASDCIELMQEMIGRLIEAGHAYAAAGSVFFDARSFPSYGALSGNRLDELRPGHRTPVGEVAPGKRFHADWGLWKAAGANRAMVWKSPWGLGFPGWHIECSAMSLRYLGESIDVHTGGIDLRFPHHEDERAQSDSSVGHEVVRHWVHGEHLLADGRKMAKSTGNVVLLTDVVERGLDPLAVRLFFLSGRYRQQLNLTWDALTAADRTLARWRARVAEWAEFPSKPMCAGYVPEVYDAFDNDLDTPAALQVLRRIERDEEIPAGSKFEMFAHLDALFSLDVVRDVGRRSDPLPADAAQLLAARAAARAAHDWAAADRLREELSALGVRVTDTPAGQTYAVR